MEHEGELKSVREHLLDMSGSGDQQMTSARAHLLEGLGETEVDMPGTPDRALRDERAQATTTERELEQRAKLVKLRFFYMK
jgi:hypothetical protein